MITKAKIIVIAVIGILSLASSANATLQANLQFLGHDVEGISSSGPCDVLDAGSNPDLYYIIRISSAVQTLTWSECTECNNTECSCTFDVTYTANVQNQGIADFRMWLLDADNGDEAVVANHLVQPGATYNAESWITAANNAGMLVDNVDIYCDNTYSWEPQPSYFKFIAYYTDTDGPSAPSNPIFSGDEVQVTTNWYSKDTKIDISWQDGDDHNSGESYLVQITESPSGTTVLNAETGCNPATKALSLCPSGGGCSFDVNFTNGNSYLIQVTTRNGCNPVFDEVRRSNSSTTSWPSIKIDTTGPRPYVNNPPVLWQAGVFALGIACGDSPSGCDINATPGSGVAGCQNSGCDSSTYGYYLQDTNTACPESYSSYTVLGTGTTSVTNFKYACTAAKDILAQVGVSNNRGPVTFPEPIYVDSSAPAVTVSGAPGAWQNTDASATVGCTDNATDQSSGCDNFTYAVALLNTNATPCSSATGYVTVGTGAQTVSGHKWVCTRGDDIVVNTGYSASPVEFKVDKTPPVSVTVTGAPASWQNTNATAVVNCTDDSNDAGGSGCDASSYRVKYTGTSGACPGDYNQYTDSTTVSYHTWVCGAAKDNAGNWTYAASSVEFKVDKTAPTTSISGMPVAWQNTDATATVNCSDTGDSSCDASTYRLLAMGVANPGSCPASYGSYTLTNPTTVSAYQWYCSAVKDVAGNIGYSVAAFEFEVDEIIPVLGTPEIYSANTHTTYYSGSAVSLRATASDTGYSTLKTDTCYYSVSGGSSYLPASWDGTYCYVTDAPVTGNIDVKFKMNDVAGNTGESAVSSYVQDNDPPVVAALGMPLNWQNFDASASVDCTDALSGCDTADYRVVVYNYDPGICPASYASYLAPDATAVSEHSWVCAAAKDNVHNFGYSPTPEEFLVDEESTIATIDGAPASWQKNNANAIAGCADSGDSSCDVDSYKLLVYTTDPGTCPADYSSYSLFSPQTVTDHSWVCSAVKDIAGNNSVSVPVEFLIDKTAPAVNAPEVFSSNVYMSFYNTGAVDIRAQASDPNGSGLNTATCEYSINNGASYAAAEWSSPYCRKQFVNVTGQINVRFRVSDLAGNQTVTDATPYTQDNDAPASAVDALAQYQTSSAFGVSWTGDDGSGARVKDFDVEYKAGAAGVWTPWKSDFAGTSDTFSGAADGTTYYFRSRAEDNLDNLEDYPSGDGDASTMVDTTFPVSSVAALDAWQTSTAFMVSWSGSDGSPGSGLKDYTIQFREGTLGSWTDWQTNTTNTSAEYTGADAAEYFFRSSSLDNAGNQEAYPPGDGDTSTQVDTSAPTTSVTAQPEFVGSTAFTLGWTGGDGVGSGVKNYDIQFRDGSAGTWMDLFSDTTMTSFTFVGEDTHSYYFQSRGEDNLGNVEDYPGGDGDTNVTVDVTDPVSQVAALDDYQTATSFAVSWSGEDGAAGSGVGSYDVQYRQGAAGMWTDWLTDTALSGGIFPFGVDGQMFFFQVRAEDGVGNVESYPGGDGDASTLVDTSAPVTSVATLGPYQAETTFTIAWGGTDVSGIKQYDVQYREGASGIWTSWQTAVTNTSADFTGNDGSTYYFQSRAEDMAGNIESYPGGDGDTSTTIDTTILPAPATISDGSGADEDYTTSTTSLSANWDAVPDAAKYLYAIGTSQTSPDVLDWQDNGTNTSVDSGSLSLSDGVKYYFFVKVQNPSGVDGQWGFSDGITVDTTAPDSSVTTLPGYTGTETFTVSWSAADAGSGIKNYDVQYKEGAGAWTDWKTDVTTTSAEFTGADGADYYFQCRAEDNLGNLESYPGGNGDTGTTLDTAIPGAPLVQDGIGGDADFTESNNSLSASWNDVAGAGSYFYGVGLATDTPSLVVWTDNGSDTSVVINGLTLSEGQTYYILVKAKNMAGVDGVVGYSDGVTIDTLAPTSSVVSLASHQGSVTFTVNWSGTDAGGSGITGYDVQFREGADGTWTDWQTGVTTTSASFTGEDGHTYFFRSRAADALDQIEDYPAGNGDTNTTVDTTAPLSEAAAMTEYQTSGSFMVAWGGGDGETGAGIKAYDVQYRDGADGAWTNWLLNTAQTEAAFTLGENGHIYYFQVRAEDNVGNEEAYPGGGGDTSTTVDTGIPTAEMVALVEYQSVEEFTVSWSGGDGAGSGIASYDVQVKDVEEGGGLWSAVWIDWQTGVAETEATFTGENGHTYYFQVRAHDVAGNASAYPGGNGHTMTIVDTSMLPGPSFVYDGTAQDADYTNSADTLSANWAQVSGAAKYFYGVGSTTDGPDMGGWTDNGENTSATVEGLALEEGSTYYFFVKVENFSGIEGVIARSDGILADFTAPVCEIEELQAYQPSESFEVSWAASDGDAGSGAAAYEIRYRNNTDGAWAAWLEASTLTGDTFNGEDRAAYYFECAATDRAGNTEAFAGAAEASTSVDTTIPDAPDTVSDGAGEDIDYATDTTVLSANWPAVADAATYEYSVSTAGGQEFIPWTDNGAGTSFSLQGLELVSGTTYVAKVRGLNNAGISGPEAVSDGVTVDGTAPEAPRVTDDGDTTNDPTQLYARWMSEDAEIPIVEYIYAIGTTEGGEEIAAFSSTNAAAEVTHAGLALENNQAYYFTVKAKNAAGLWSEPGTSDGITYRMTQVAVEVTYLPQEITITPDTGETITYTFAISGNSGLKLDREKVYFELPSRDYEAEDNDVSIEISMESPELDLYRSVSFEEAILTEALAGGQSATVNVRRVFTGYDDDTNEVEVSITVPVQIETTLGATEVLEITNAAITVGDSIEVDTKYYPKLVIDSKGVPNRVSGRIVYGDNRTVPVSFIAKGGGQSETFTLPPLNTSEPGTYRITAIIDSPNYLETDVIEYEVVIPELDYEVLDVTVESALNRVIKGDKLVATLGIEVGGEGGTVKGAAVMNGEEWQYFELPLPGGGEVSYFDSPPLPSQKEGKNKLAVRIFYPTKIESEVFEYEVVESKFMLPGELPLPHTGVALLRTKDGSGNVSAATAQDKEGVKIWSREGKPLKVKLPVVGLKTPLDAEVPEDAPLVYTFDDDYTDVASWKYKRGSAEVSADEVTLGFSVLGDITIRKKSGQAEPLLSLGADGLVINGEGTGKGIKKAEFNNLTINAASPPRITTGEGVFEIDGGTVVLTNEHEDSPLAISFKEEAATDDGMLLSAVAGVTAELILDRDGLHFPSGSWPVVFSYSYGEYVLEDEISVMFDELVLDVYAEDEEHAVKSGRAVFTTRDGEPVNLAQADAPNGFTLNPEFWNLMIGNMVPEKVPLPDEEIMYARLRDTSGNLLVNVDVTTSDSFSQALKFKMWAKPGTPLQLFIPALKIDENNDDDADRPLELSVGEDSPLLLSCSPDCSHAENWKVERGDIEFPPLPPVPYAGVVLNLKGLAFDPVKKMLFIAGAVDFKLGENESSYSVDFEKLQLTKNGVGGTIDIEDGAAAEPFTYSSTQFGMKSGVMFFESQTMESYAEGLRNRASEQTELLQAKITGINGKKTELERKKQRYESQLRGLENEKLLLAAAIPAMDSQAKILESEERIKSLETQIGLVNSEVGKIETALASGQKRKSDLEGDIQKMQGAASAVDTSGGGGMSLVHIFSMDGEIQALPLFGDLSSSPVEFGDFKLSFDPLDGYRPKISGDLSLGDSEWYSKNVGTVVRDGGDMSGEPLFSTEAWGGKIDFAIYSAFLRFNDNRLSDAGFAGGLNYSPEGAVASVKSVMNISFDSATGMISGSALLPNLPPVDFAGMSLDFDSGYADLVYDMNSGSTEIDFYGLAGMLKALPEPMGTFEVPVPFRNARISENGFSALFSNQASNMPLKSFGIFDSGTDKMTVDLNTVNIYVEDNEIVRGSLSTALLWERGSDLFEFGGTLEYAQDGSISGDVDGIDLSPFKIDEMAWVDINDGHVFFSIGQGGDSFEVSGLSGEFVTFPFAKDYDPANKPLTFENCGWDSEGFDCKALYNSDENCGFSGGGALFTKALFTDEEKNPEFDMDLDITGACGIIENTHFTDFKARAAVKLAHEDSVNGQKELYSGDIDLALNREGTPMLYGGRSDVKIEIFNHYGLAMEVTGGEVSVMLAGDEFEGVFDGLAGEVIGLPGISGMDMSPISFTDFSIAWNGLAGFIDGISGVGRHAVLHGVPVKLEISKLRFSPKAFAMNAVAKIPASSRDSLPEDVKNQLDGDCFEAELPMVNAGFLYSAQLEVYYGRFKNTLSCGKDIGLSSDGFVGGYVYALPPIPMPGIKTAFMRLKSDLVMQPDGSTATGIIKNMNVDIHLPLTDADFPAGPAAAAQYIEDNPGTHRRLSVDVDGEISIACNLNNENKATACSITGVSGGAGVSAAVDPPLIINRGGFQVKLTGLQYGKGEVCGANQPYLAATAVVDALPGIGNIEGGVSFTPYITAAGLCGTSELDLPEIDMAGFGLDINSGVIELAVSGGAQTFTVRELAGAVTRVPGLYLGDSVPRFTGNITDGDYEFSFTQADLNIANPVEGMNLNIQQVSATLTPADNKLRMNAAFGLPEGMAYNGEPIAADLWAEKNGDTVEYGVEQFTLEGASIRVFGMADLVLNKAHFEESMGAVSYVTVDDGDLEFSAEGIPLSLPIEGLTINSRRIAKIELDVDYSLGFTFFTFEVGKVAFIKPVTGDAYLTFTGKIEFAIDEGEEEEEEGGDAGDGDGDSGGSDTASSGGDSGDSDSSGGDSDEGEGGKEEPFGGLSIKAEVKYLNAFKIYADNSIDVGGLSIDADTPLFRIAGEIYLMDFDNDEKINVIKAVCDACEDVISENLYLQDSDDKKDFAGEVILDIKEVFEFQAAAAFLSDGSFGIYLAMAMPPPGLPLGGAVGLTDVMGGIMMRREPTPMFALSLGGGLAITGTEKLLKGKAALTLVAGDPTMLNICACASVGNIGDDPVCEIGGSASIFFTPPRGFLGTFTAACKVPPKTGKLLALDAKLNLCFREEGGCFFSHDSDSVIHKCMNGASEREENVNFEGTARILDLIDVGLGFAITKNDGADFGARVVWEGELGDTDIVGVWYYLMGEANLCRIGKSGMWGRVMLGGGAGVSVIGIDLFTIDIAAELSFYTDPWRFVGKMGGGACIGLWCGREVCEGCLTGDCCPHNPGQIRSTECGTPGSCAGIGFLRIGGCLAFQLEFGG